jgi:hypothetical protein
MADIFISYASEDRPRAKQLADALVHRGWEVWWDRKIPVGRSFHQTIEKAIDDARCVIVLWSTSSIDSDWVRNEAGEGQRRNILAPVLLENVLPPLGFRHLQAADLSDWAEDEAHPAFESLLETVQAVVAAPPRIATSPKPAAATTDHSSPQTSVAPRPAMASTAPQEATQSPDTGSSAAAPRTRSRLFGLKVLAGLCVAFVAGIALWQAMKPQPAVPPAVTGSSPVDAAPAAAISRPNPSGSAAAANVGFAWTDPPFVVFGVISTSDHSSPRPLKGSVYDEKGVVVARYNVPAVVKGLCPDKCEISAKIPLESGSTTARMLLAKLNVRREGDALLVETCPQVSACRKGLVVQGVPAAEGPHDFDQMRGIIDKYNKSAKEIIDGLR